MSMKEDKYDKLENLFRSRLGDADQSPENWNTPPVSLLDGALDVVNEDYNRKRRGFWLWISIGLLLLGFTAGMTFNHYKIQNLNQEILSLQNKQDELTKLNTVEENPIEVLVLSEENKSTNNTNSTIKSSEAILSSPATNIEERNSTTTSEKNSATKNHSTTNTSKQTDLLPAIKAENSLVNNSITPPNNTNTKHEIISDHLFIIPINENQNKIQIEDQTWKSPLEEKERAHVTIAKLSSFSNQVLQHDSALPESQSFIAIMTNTEEYTSWSPYVFVGSQLSSYKMKNVSEFTGSQLTDYDRLYAGIEVGIGVEKKISNQWSAFGNISYQRINNSSAYRENMNYDKNNEVIMSSGTCIYQMDYDVETPMGIQSRSVTMDMTDVNIGDNETIQNITDISHSIDIISSSAGFKFELLRKNRISLNANSGVTANYIVNLRESMTTKMYYQTDMVMEKTTLSQGMDGVNKVYGSVNAGLDLSYQLSNHFRIGLGGSYDQSISSIRKSSTLAPTKTYLSNLRSSLNLTYQF